MQLLIKYLIINYINIMESFTNFFSIENIDYSENENNDHFLLMTKPIVSMLKKIVITSSFWYEGTGND